jgi:dienelactone hydrolase
MSAIAKADSAAIDPEHVAIVEAVRDSEYPVHLMYVEMIDGLYAPIGLRKPTGSGPFPMVVFASGNGGGGMAVIHEYTQNRSWTQERFLAAGYAVAWLRYRAEVDYAYDKIGKLVEDRRQARQLFNRGPLEYEDAISTVEYLKTLPYIDADRVGYLGMSHGGEMAPAHRPSAFAAAFWLDADRVVQEKHRPVRERRAAASRALWDDKYEDRWWPERLKAKRPVAGTSAALAAAS